MIYGWKHFLDDRALAADPLAELVRVYQEANNAATPAAIRDPEAGEEEPAGGTVVADACRAELAKLQSGDPENLAIWQRCVDLSRAELDKIYAELGIHFDHQFGESFFNPQLAPLVRRLEECGIAEPSEGALVVFFRQPGDDPKLADRPAIIRKRDGAFNYATTDIATYEQRVNEFKADALWYVVGFAAGAAFRADQRDHPAHGLHRAASRTFPSAVSSARTARSCGRAPATTWRLRDLLDEAVERARQAVEEKNAEMSRRGKSRDRARSSAWAR